MEVKAVFFDIDGTLVNNRKSVLKSTKDAIKIVKEQGVLVGVATGRGPFFVKELMDDLDLDFAVTYNGQYIFSKDRVLFTSPISKLHLRHLISYAKKEGTEIALGTKDAMLGSKIMSFGLGSFSQRISRFVPSVLTRTVSQSFNRMVSKVVPQKEEDLLHLMNQPIYQVLMLMTPEESEKAADKVAKKTPAQQDLIGQVDALIDTLYFTYGSFVLMGVDPERIFDIVHQANMGKIFPDGKAHFDPVTHKILKPDNWEEKYAPEPAIKKELQRQLKAYERHKERNKS
ncbi:TPA: HAD hydrolase family protein [Streptococcus pneumoniae]